MCSSRRLSHAQTYNIDAAENPCAYSRGHMPRIIPRSVARVYPRASGYLRHRIDTAGGRFLEYAL